MAAALRPARIAAVLAAALMAGCGSSGAPSQKALQQQATAIGSLAAEGELLAGTAARGRSTSAFVRIQADALGKAADSSAAAVAKGRGADALRLRRLAERVGADLGRLAHSGSDRPEQRRLQRDLSRAADAAARIGRRL